jgi:hypothetical protein
MGNGFRVYEQTGHQSHYISFESADYDVFMFMDTAGLRSGMKLAPPESRTLVPWIGVPAGVYMWNVDFTNLQRDRSWHILFTR